MQYHHPKNLSNIQTLRAVAAIMVVVLHGFLMFPATEYHYMIDWGTFYNIGAAGVDLFFVISGFIMVYVQKHRNYTPRQFITHRVARIVPLYWLTIAGLVGIYLIMPNAFNRLVITPESMVQALSFTTYAFSQGTQPIVYVGWTLECEMLFYVIFAACLFIRNRATSLITCIILLLIATALRGQYIMLEFILGMAVALAPRISKGVAIACLVGGIVALIGYVPEVTPDQTVPYYRPILWGLPTMLIVLAAINLPQKGYLKRLGDASYSIYLVQTFTIPAFYKATHLLGISGMTGEVYIAICALFTIVAGYASYLLLEKPITRFIKDFLPKKPSVT